MRRLGFLGLLTTVLSFAQQAQLPATPANTTSSNAPLPHFEDVGQQAGLTVSHISSPDKRYIIESVSGGIGLIDCNNDGKLDIVTVNGSNVDRYRKTGGDLLVTLYQHHGSGRTRPQRLGHGGGCR